MKVRYIRKPEPASGCWKYVRVAGRYRWIGCADQHKDCVGPTEHAESAGIVEIKPGVAWTVLEWRSMGLGIDADEADIQAISEILGLPFEENERRPPPFRV